MDIKELEVFNFTNNEYKEFENNGNTYLLNQHPYLDIVLTDHCNQNCSFCIADLIHHKLNADLIIFKKKVEFAINNMNIDEVLLLGGEPTVSNVLIPIIKYLKTLPLKKIIMTTNGIRLARDEKYREKVFSSGLTHVNISFMNIEPVKQGEITDNVLPLTLYDLALIYETAKKNKVTIRINNNIFIDNNDTVNAMLNFYNTVKPYCDQVKFSPLFAVDNFSVVNVKTNWVKEHILTDGYVDALFTAFESTMRSKVLILENPMQFGFVKNTLIPLKIPIIMNWNFGKYTGMMDKVVKEKKINNIKLLPNNELSLSWNREDEKYFIKTD